MKAEYEFDFSTAGFRFEKDHSYTCTLTTSVPLPNNLGDGKGQKVDFKIQRDELQNPELGASQCGKLYVTIPFRREGMDEFVYGLVQAFSQRIHFNCTGRFNVDLACYLGRQIPENDDEEEELGGAPNFAVLRLVEDIGEPIFDSKSFVNSSAVLDGPLIALFNHAFREENPIDKFLNYFKIIEDHISSSSGKTLKQQLLRNETVKNIYAEAARRSNEHQSYDEFVNEVVNARHECAHFKRRDNFGFHIGDLRLKRICHFHMPLLEVICYKLTLNESETST